MTFRTDKQKPFILNNFSEHSPQVFNFIHVKIEKNERFLIDERFGSG